MHACTHARMPGCRWYSFRHSPVLVSLGPSLHLFVSVCHWLSFALCCRCRSLLSVLSLLVPPCLCLPMFASARLCSSLFVSVCFCLWFALFCCCCSLLSVLSILFPFYLYLSLFISVCPCLSFALLCCCSSSSL